ncbi:MAG: hypothetical protein LBP87_13245 [Planctomycetaceae bacterium]|nr:hypothetical protein [Planctomycetaceae bacterium]
MKIILDKTEDNTKMQRRFYFNSHIKSHLNSHFKSHIKSLFLRTLFIALLVSTILIVVGKSEGVENGENTQDIESANIIDNDDIEAKVDSPIKIAQEGSGKGIVWGKSIKSKDLEAKAETQATVPQTRTETSTPLQKTTVQRPISAVRLPEKTEPAKLPANIANISEEKFLLKSSRQSGSTDLVETLLEVTGDVKQVSNDLKATTDKMEVVAGFRYEERVEQFSHSTGPLVSIRQYNLAKSKMKIGEQIKMPELDEELQTIVCSLEGDKVSLFSPRGLLRGEQLLLIEDLPGNTLTLDRLLPNKEMRVGDTWKISDSVLRSFLSVDAVTESNVEAVLTAVADKMAMIEVVGDVSGVYLGAATEMSIRAKFQFDLNLRRINWLGLLIEENRSIGHVGPGLDLVARLQVKISPIEVPQVLTDNAIREINTKPSDNILKLKYNGGKGPWRFSHDRDWYIFQDDPQTTILRKLHKGELVAQCNIADMGKVDIKTMTTLDKFKKELADGLGKNFGKIVAAGEHTNKFGYKVFTVLIDGTVEELSLRWIYNLMTDQNGQQSVVVFVVEADMLEQFADADEVLLKTYQMGKK